jgi:hypothetical protein
VVLEAAVGVWFEKTEFGSTYFLLGFIPFFLPAFALLGGCMCCLTCKCKGEMELLRTMNMFPQHAKEFLLLKGEHKLKLLLVCDKISQPRKI